MSDLQQIIVLATNILQPQNNELRSQSEKALIELRDSSPNELVILFVNLLESNYTYWSTIELSCCFFIFNLFLF